MKEKVEEARAILEKEKQDRAKKCDEEILAVLAKYNCDIAFSLTIDNAGTITPIIGTVAK